MKVFYCCRCKDEIDKLPNNIIEAYKFICSMHALGGYLGFSSEYEEENETLYEAVSFLEQKGIILSHEILDKVLMFPLHFSVVEDPIEGAITKYCCCEVLQKL